MREVSLRLKKDPAGGPLVADLELHQSYKQWEEALASSIGGGYPESGQRLLRNYLPAMGIKTSSSIEDVNGAVGALIAAAPQDPLEAQIIAQALVCSHHALNLMAKAGGTCSQEVQQQWLSLATRLMRLNTQQLDAIGRYRRKGEQHITVEKLNINSGAQAVIGSVNH